MHLKYKRGGKLIFRQLTSNFADFRRNNSEFMQKNRILKKYHLRGKLMF